MIRRIFILPIRFYQLAISPYLGRWCRFEPSCSEYARQAILLHGMCRGSWLAVKRLSRCHPFCDGGIDPVPGSLDAMPVDPSRPLKPPTHSTHFCHG